VLNANPSDQENGLQPNNAKAPYFAHLIGASVSARLNPSTCIYFDGIAADLCIPEMLDLVEGWFSKWGSKPKVVLVGAGEERAPRYTVKSLRIAASADEAAARRSFNTLQFFPKGRTTIDDTWRPSIYCAISIKCPTSAFFCVNEDVETTDLLPLLRRGDEVFRSCASYGFWFPERFSPLGYYWGIAVEPAGRRDGAWGKQQMRRLSHWRDNTSIGVVSDRDRRFFGPCDGYVRDVYPLMLLDDRHMRRGAGGTTLLERITGGSLGEVQANGKKSLWCLPPGKLAAAQRLLDESDITLSGRRLEGVKYRH